MRFDTLLLAKVALHIKAEKHFEWRLGSNRAYNADLCRRCITAYRELDSRETARLALPDWAEKRGLSHLIGETG